MGTGRPGLPVCGRPGAVASPDECTDGHGADCPDRLCVHCCSALFVDPVLVAMDRPVRRTA